MRGQMSELIVFMGPSGCGKSTLASAYAANISCPFIEADDYHPAENIALMSAGKPLTDSHRTVWLDALISAANAKAESNVVLACSALTPYVQNRLVAESKREVVFLYCRVPQPVLARRLGQREGHFMPATLLASQLDAFTLPGNALTVDADAAIDIVLGSITKALENYRKAQSD